jgi:glycosyltransferase involved in cell wall biosynthesis
MKSQPLVSILINNYNYGRFLKTAIESALNQTYQPTEVIVVDDGSTDQSREIISSYGDRIKPILKENGGQASAFNAGFAASQGEIVCFLDSDDLFKSKKVTAVVHDFQQDPTIGWHFHSLELFGSHSDASRQELDLATSNVSGLYDLRSYLQKGKLRGSLSFELSTATSGMCFRRSLLEQILPVAEEIRITSDDYIKYAALGISCGFISFHSLAQQRIHGNNAYTSNSTILELRAKTQILTAHSLKDKFPKLSKFSNNLVAMGIGISWWIGSAEFGLQSLIKDYLRATTFSERFEIYLKSIYYRFIYHHLVAFGFKR